jgi:hypothetical protein
VDDVITKLVGYGWPGIFVLAALGACVQLWRARERDRERAEKTLAESHAREQKAQEQRTADAQAMTATLLQQHREANVASNSLAQATCDLTDEIRRALDKIDRRNT